MSKNLTLTAMQRIRLELLLDVQTGRRRSELQVFDDVRIKVKLSEEERELAGYRELPNGNIEFNPEKAGVIPPVSLALENAERVALSSLLDSWPHFTTRDKRFWLDDLWEQLQRN